MVAPKNFPIIHWFRQDLRIADNPSLFNAASQGKVLPIYILDDTHAGDCRMGAASRWWLHDSLVQLNKSLDGKLAVFRGDAEKIIMEVVKEHRVSQVYWNRCYEPWRIRRDQRIKERLSQQGIAVKSFNGSLLWEPWEVLKTNGNPYKVFTPFYYKGCLRAHVPRAPLPAPRSLSIDDGCKQAIGIDDLALRPAENWVDCLATHWDIGEDHAMERLHTFLREGLENYKDGRDYPAQRNVSRLSPHLHFGEVSPHQVWDAVGSRGEDRNIDRFCAELGWREFSYHLLYHFPGLPEKNFNPKFDRFGWHEDAAALKRWQSGQTGYPIVDAGMRELWNTGYMHNRVRMIAGSFLVKNLLIHWHYGERWFWDCLVDADLANNSAGWQWIAGCGADAAPYFRIFNPGLQGQKFDPRGEYIRRWVPELASLPNRYIASPWEASDLILQEAGIVLGQDYPKPMVDLKQSRQRALDAFAKMKAKGQTQGS